MYMSIKTVALDSRVYDRLAAEKREGESFSKLIDRLLTEVGAAHTGGDILRGLEAMPVLSEADADTMLKVIAEDRDDEEWVEHDLR
jgi:predicted CopG family antitoxin